MKKEIRKKVKIAIVAGSWNEFNIFDGNSVDKSWKLWIFNPALCIVNDEWSTKLKIISGNNIKIGVADLAKS